MTPQKEAFPKIILVVDDEPAISRLMKDQLEANGYAVITVEKGSEVLEVVKNTKLFAVLLDIGLPDIEGFQVLQAIKKINQSVPVIMVTGRHEESEGRKAFNLGAWDYVTKPVDFQYLTNILLLQSTE